MSWVEKCWMVTSKISVIALLMITGIYFGKFVCPYIKKKKGAVAVSIVYITIMLVLYMIPPQIDNFSAYLIGVMAAFLAMYVEDRRNIYQKIFLAITFFSIRWLTVAMAARLDDLVTKEPREPYRMMTSRAEYRLLLRQDNADLRLARKGYQVGLLSEERYNWVLKKEKMIQEEIERVKQVNVGANKKTQKLLEECNSAPLNNGIKLTELIRRPELNYDLTKEIDLERPELPFEVREQVNILIKYDGYIKRQMKQVESFKKLENKHLPENLDYESVMGLRIEARQKLEQFRPTSIGQAGRIAGVTPADISVLLIYMEQLHHKQK